jgi:predicted anti-sigma-YlaC factor YlaD
MSHDGRCPEAETLAQLSAGELRGRQLQACLRHLEDCPRCRVEAEALARLRALLQEAPTPAAPPDLRPRICLLLPSLRKIRALTCRRAHALISAWLDGEVAEADRERLWAHLFRCAPCLRRFRETESLSAAARRSPTRDAQPAPRYLPQRILAAVAREESQRRRQPARRAPVAVRRTGFAALAGAAVLALVLLAGLRAPAPGPAVVAQSPRETAGAAAPAVAPTPGVAAPPTVPAAAGVAGEPPGVSGVAPARTVSAVPATLAEAGRGWLRNLLSRPPAPSVVLPAAENPTQPAPSVTTPPAPPLAVALVPAPAFSPTPEAVPAPAPVAPVVPAPAPAPAPPMVLASLPSPAPAAADQETAPAPSGATPGQPESARALLLTPVQGNSVVVYERHSADQDLSLAIASRSLNKYARDQQRSQPRELIVAR